ncbi:MAG TPA: thrombospondin type 3 repeat-containing protein [Kofleriaceae bacterium]
MKSTALWALTLFACAPDATFHCASSEQCRDGGSTGTCETTGFCSFADSSCDSGARYSADSAGSLSGTCVEGSSGVDRDGDGIPDGQDNCPSIANPDQGNEDGDAYGDVCDPCPYLADATVVDADGDGLDDRCDPHLGDTDHVVLFEGFHHGLPASWTTTGVFTPDGDGVLGKPATGDTLAIAHAPYAVTSADGIVIYAGITPIDITTMTGTHGEALLAGFEDPDYIACQMKQTTNGAGSQIFQAIETKLGTTDSMPWAIAVNNTYIVRATYDGVRDFACRVEREGANTSGSIMTAIAPPAADLKLGLLVENAAARLEWIMVVSN